MPTESAAERNLFAIAPDGTQYDVALRVGIPTQAAPGEWRTWVSLGALDARQPFISGIDSWQALSLAMAFVATRLKHFHEDGWLFYHELDDEALSQEELANDLAPMAEQLGKR
jgi:hypothetical protein